jgi:hypothetical protein
MIFVLFCILPITSLIPFSVSFLFPATLTIYPSGIMDGWWVYGKHKGNQDGETELMDTLNELRKRERLDTTFHDRRKRRMGRQRRRQRQSIKEGHRQIYGNCN